MFEREVSSRRLCMAASSRQMKDRRGLDSLTTCRRRASLWGETLPGGIASDIIYQFTKSRFMAEAVSPTIGALRYGV